MAKSNNNQKKLVGQSEFGEEVWELIDRLIEAGILSTVERSKTGPFSDFETAFFNGEHFNSKFFREFMKEYVSLTDLFNVFGCVEDIHESSDIIRKMLFDYLAVGIVLKNSNMDEMQDEYRRILAEHINILEEALSEIKKSIADMTTAA